MCVFFKRLLGLSFISPPYRKLFSPSLITKDIGLLIRCISLFQLHRGLGDILPCDFMRNVRACWPPNSNNNFHILNSVTHIFSPTCISKNFKKLQTTILKLLYQTPPSLLLKSMKFIVYFSSELICKFFLTALTRRWLPFSQASTMNNRPEQTSSISRYA